MFLAWVFSEIWDYFGLLAMAEAELWHIFAFWNSDIKSKENCNTSLVTSTICTEIIKHYVLLSIFMDC